MPAHISVLGRISWARVFQTWPTYRFIVSTLFSSEHRGPFILVRIESYILIGWRKMPHISIVHSQLLLQIRILVLRHLDSVHPAKHRHIILLLSSSRFLLQTNIIGRFASTSQGHVTQGSVCRRILDFYHGFRCHSKLRGHKLTITSLWLKNVVYPFLPVFKGHCFVSPFWLLVPQ